MNSREGTYSARTFQQTGEPGPERASASVVQHGFDVLIDSVLDYAFITFDLDSRITSWNAGATRILGYSEAEILSQPGALFFTLEDRRNGEVERELASALQEGRAEDERWHLRKDGSVFWGSGVTTLLRDGSGQPVGFAKVFRDLTSQRAAQEALRESENRFRLFADNVRDHALFQVNPAGRISDWNSGAERLFGYTAPEILGHPVYELFPPEDRAIGYPEQELAATLERGQMQDARWLLRRDGTRFFAAWVTHPMYDDAGHLRGYAKVLRDETDRFETEELRRREEEQERTDLLRVVETTGAELDRTKDELRALAGSLMKAQEEERRWVARELHDDVSQGLAILEMQLALIQGQPEIPSDLNAQFERLRSQINAVSERVRTLSHRLHPSILDHLGLLPALRSLGSDFQERQNITVHLISFPLARAVPLPVASALYRVAQEALRNVAKHAPGSLVTLRVTEREDELELSIHDNGPGFDPIAVKHQNGLGLVSMEERIRLLGGSFALYTKPGGGTQITVRVPIAGGA